MRIKSIEADQFGCYEYRIMNPTRALEKFGGHEIHSSQFLTPEERQALYDVYLIQRNYGTEMKYAFRWLKEHGCLTVYDLDDRVHTKEEGYEKNPGDYQKPETVEGLLDFIRTVDLITTSTKSLADFFRRYNSNVEILPNQLNLDKWNPIFERRQSRLWDGKIRIGFSGSYYHIPDIASIVDTLVKIMTKYPNVVLKFIGFHPKPFEKQLRPFTERIEYIPWMLPADYPKHLYDFDIGIAPLTQNLFNQCKSNCKWLEYSSLAIPSIGTQIEPYQEAIEKKLMLSGGSFNGLFQEQLERLIEDRNFREELGMKAREYVVENFSIEKNWLMWQEVYLKNLKKK